MKKAYLIYYQEEAQRNAAFIEMFQRWGREYGISFTWIAPEQMLRAARPSLVLNRTRNPGVSLYYERLGIPVQHSSLLVRLGNDKYQALQYLKQRLPSVRAAELPRTYYLPAEEMKKLIQGERRLPWQGVIKAVDGHGGRQVFLTEQETEWKEVLAGHNCILQERLDSDGEDLRVYILGGKIYQSVLRKGRGDFRSNYSLGGSVSPYALHSGEMELVQQYIDCLGGAGIGMAGIDFIRTRNGKLVFNEFEEMVGSRMLYRCTDCDIVHDYVKWLQRTLVPSLPI